MEVGPLQGPLTFLGMVVIVIQCFTEVIHPNAGHTMVHQQACLPLVQRLTLLGSRVRNPTGETCQMRHHIPRDMMVGDVPSEVRNGPQLRAVGT